MILTKLYKEKATLPTSIDPTVDVNKRGWVEIQAFNEGLRKEQMAFSMTASQGAGGQELTLDVFKAMQFKAERRIVRWGNFQDEDGNDIPCNSRNKLLFISQDGVEDWLKEQCVRIDEEAIKKKKAQEKNLKN